MDKLNKLILVGFLAVFSMAVVGLYTDNAYAQEEGTVAGAGPFEEPTPTPSATPSPTPFRTITPSPSVTPQATPATQVEDGGFLQWLMNSASLWWLLVGAIIVVVGVSLGRRRRSQGPPPSPMS